MRNLHELDSYRYGETTWGEDGLGGSFMIPSRIDGKPLRVIASNGEGWDHVSVSRKNRCPNWDEMEQIARLFFKDDEYAFQLHVPPAQHLSLHPHCLHWWRPHAAPIPLPPSEFVAIPGTLDENRRYLEKLQKERSA